MERLRNTQKNSFKYTYDTFYMIAFKFPRDVDDDDGDGDVDSDDDDSDDDDDKAVTSNKLSNLKWKDFTMDSGRWNSSKGTLKVIGSVPEKLRVRGLNA
jgi:hypothetical protein